jgi:hypothetical protein
LPCTARPTRPTLKLLIMHFSPSSFLPHRCKNSPQHPQHMFCPKRDRPRSHPYKTTEKIISFYISIFTLLSSRRNDRR